jgi:ribosomal protein S18 acetylase RimI-like enzyme
MIEIRDLRRHELSTAAALIAQAMRDDPIYQAVFGSDADHRVERLHRFFAALLPVMNQAPLSAWEGGRLIGIVSYFPPGTCWPSLAAQLRIAYRMLTPNLAELWRMWQWLRASDAHEPGGRFCHVGAVAVAVNRQHQGIGGQLLEAFCARMDAQGESAFLETDKHSSVRFYARFGFEVTGNADVLETPNWWMLRQAQTEFPAKIS